jgi:hypothetical protein
MKKFATHFVTVGCLLLILLIVLDFLYTESFKSGEPRNKVQLLANLTDTNVDYIFLGSSRTENHIDCAMIEKLTGKSCLNVGMQAGRIKDYRIMVQLINDNKVTFENLFVQVDYSYNLDDHSASFLAYFMPFKNDMKLSEQVVEDINVPFYYSLPFLRYAANEKKISFREVVLQYAEKPTSLDLKNGFVPLNGIGNEISGHFPSHISAQNDALQDIIDMVERNKLILFTAPYCENGENRNVFMQELKERYIGLKDYSNLFDNNKEVFVNCGHLNKNGAYHFTKKLTEDLLLKQTSN